MLLTFTVDPHHIEASDVPGRISRELGVIMKVVYGI